MPLTTEDPIGLTFSLRLILGLLISLLSSSALIAQSTSQQPIVLEGTERMDFDRPESWALKYFANVSMLGSFRTPEPSTPGSVDLEAELGWIPSLSEDQRRVGFVGNKVEDLNRNDLYGRLRARFGLPGSFSVLVALSPPVELNGVSATLFNLALERPIYQTSNWRLGARAYGQLGGVEGDFTCPADIVGIDDPEINPDDCLEASSDEVSLDYLGAELSATRRLSSDRWRIFFGLAGNYLDLGFQVDARYSVFIDRVNLVTSGWTWAGKSGLGYRASDRFRVSGELFFAPLTVQRSPISGTENDNLFTLRFLAGYSIR